MPPWLQPANRMAQLPRRYRQIGRMKATLRLAILALVDISVEHTFIVEDSTSIETTTFDAVAITADGPGNFKLSELNAGT